MKRKIALIRYHDGKAKPNWGGRATSLALAGLINGIPDTVLHAPINGTFITKNFEDPPRSGFGGLLEKISRRVGIKKTNVLKPFQTINDVADSIINGGKNQTETQSDLLSLIRSSDEVWMNGEGNYILCKQNTLWRSLLIMAIANRLGKKTILLNSILSIPTYQETDNEVIDAVHYSLRNCATILYRDAISLDLHNSLFPDIPASWVPDALFNWSLSVPSIDSLQNGLFSPYSERLDPLLQNFLGSGNPYVLISGASGLREAVSQQMIDLSIDLIDQLRINGFEPILVSTDAHDEWLAIPAKRTGSFFVEANIPLCSGMLLFSNASAFISGRYHPSIIAANLGVPSVYMESNSHKTQSLQTTMNISNPKVFSFFSSDTEMPSMIDASIKAAKSSDEVRKMTKNQAQINGKIVLDTFAIL